MRKLILFMVVFGMIGTVVADTASAQLLFRKIKQRRREELRAELHAQLQDELSTKMDADMAREMKIATDTIRSAAEAKVAEEAQRLQQQVATAVASMRAESKQQLADAAKQLEQQTATGLVTVKKQGQRIARANKKYQADLGKQFADLTANLTAEQKLAAEKMQLAFAAQLKVFQTKIGDQLKLTDTQLAEVKALQADVARALVVVDKTRDDMVTTVGDRLALIDEEIQLEVKKQLPKPPAKPEPPEQPEEPGQPEATNPAPVELKNDDSQDDDDDSASASEDDSEGDE